MVETEGTDVLVTEPVKVNAESVEKELANLWRGAASGEISGTTAPLSRTLLLNVLVYTNSETQAAEASSIVAELAAQYPSRAVIVDAEPKEARQELEAEVSMFCSIGERGRRLCGEEIRIHAHGSNTEALGAIIPALAPDLPVYLCSFGDTASSHDIMASLTSASDHWIVDSRHFEDAYREYKSAVDLALTRPQMALHDLAWNGLCQWRELTAQLFDPVPARQYLTGPCTITVESNTTFDGGPRIDALMMAAWLITQMEWQNASFTKPDRITATVQDRETFIHFVPGQDQCSTISAITMRSETEGGHGVFRVWRPSGTDEVRIETDGPNLTSARRTIPLERASRATEVRRILDLAGRDKLYERCLPALLKLIRDGTNQ